MSLSGNSAVFVMGPAGSGKSTFCDTMMKHCQAMGRSVHLVNLDPAAEKFEYEPTIGRGIFEFNLTPILDIRSLISLEDAMEEMEYGPNGGLIFCLEYLVENLDWLDEQLGDYNNDFLIIDCPGQIELYTHYPIMRTLIESFQQRWSYSLCGIYCLESQFIQDTTKYFSGVLSAMSAMVQLEIPHLNVMTKMDILSLVKDKQTKSRDIERYLDPDPTLLEEWAKRDTSERFTRLNQAIVQLIDNYNMVQFLPLDITDEDSIELVMSHIDHSLQYGEHQEPKEPRTNDETDTIENDS